MALSVGDISCRMDEHLADEFGADPQTEIMECAVAELEGQIRTAVEDWVATWDAALAHRWHA